MSREFLPDTPGRARARINRWDVVLMAATMMRNRGPAKLANGDWVYGLTMGECVRRVLAELRWE